MRFKHFAERCRERGITSVDPVILALDIEKAVREEDHRKVERVYGYKGSSVWRFYLPVEGIFFAVLDDASGKIKTVITQEMLRTYKDMRKGRARSIRGAVAAREHEETVHHTRNRRRRLRRKWN